jgi:hypothetical protein
MRRLLAVALLAPCLALATPATLTDAVGTTALPATATLGLTVNTLPGTRWTCGLAGLAATLTECQALAAGRTYFITDIVVGTTTATSGTYSIQSGTGTNCGTGGTAVFPAAPGTTSSRYQAPIAANPVAVIALRQPLAVTTAHAICVIGVATNTININLSGYYL